jgi:hypothetical protein
LRLGNLLFQKSKIYMKSTLLHSTFMNKAKRLNTSKKFFKNNAFFMPTPYNKSTILENASHSRKDKTLLSKHD